MALFRRQAVLLAVLVQVSDGGEDLNHLSAVGAGVHHHRAAQAAGDAVGKLQAGQAPAQSGHGQPGQRDAALRPQAAVDLPGLVQTAGLDDKAVVSRIGHQQIAAVAKEKGGDPQCSGSLHRRLDLFFLSGQRHQPGRAAHPEGGVAGHRLFPAQLQLRTRLAQFFTQRVIDVHFDLQ